MRIKTVTHIFPTEYVSVDFNVHMLITVAFCHALMTRVCFEKRSRSALWQATAAISIFTFESVGTCYEWTCSTSFSFRCSPCAGRFIIDCHLSEQENNLFVEIINESRKLALDSLVWYTFGSGGTTISNTGCSKVSLSKLNRVCCEYTGFGKNDESTLEFKPNWF